MRPMRYPAGVKRNHALFNMLPTHKVPIHIIQYFIAVYIAVVVRRRNGLRMVIIQPGHK